METMNPLMLFRRPPAAADDEWAQDSPLDTPTFSRRTGEWSSGVRRVRAKPLAYETCIPQLPGLYLWREPGTTRLVAEVFEGPDGRMWFGWTDLPARPIPQGFEWSLIQEPRG